LLALLSREIALVWIALFLAHLFLVEKKLSLRFRMFALLCCASVILLYFGLRQLPQQRLTTVRQEGWGPPVRAMLMARALGDYGGLMVFPWNLHMERSVFDPVVYRSNGDWRNAIGSEYMSILGLFFLGAFLFGSIKKGRGQAARIFGASWFLAAYLPISNIVQLNATSAEHWLYLPSVGLLIFLGGCAFELPIRYRHAVAALAAVAVICLGARSFVRSSDWASEETFFKRTLAAGGSSTRVAVNLGQAYVRRGNYSEAEKLFRRVIEITPDYPTARNSLADLLVRQGKKDEAEKLLETSTKNAAQTRKDYPRTWISAVSLARLRHAAKDDQGALTILEEARLAYPQIWEIVSFETELVRETRGPEAALHFVEDFAHDNWWHYSSALALGRLYAQKDDIERAEKALRRASWLDIHDTEALRLIVLIRLRQNRFEEAALTQRRAIARQPDEPRQYVLLSDILEKMGRNEEARTELAKASRLRALAEAPVAVN
jgi:Flp pilus assembly protein TadD